MAFANSGAAVVSTVAVAALIALFTCSSSSVMIVDAFAPSFPVDGRRPAFADKVRPLSLARGDDNAADNDDDDDIDLSDQDWRTFRAKLVMKEPTEEDTSRSSPSATSEAFLEAEDDLDGIGAVFASSGELSPSSFTPLDPDQWAYDSGKLIEEGAVILGGVEQDFGFGLRQQYFHKVCILVLNHDENQFTKGIILNRPTEKYLDDDLNPGVRWRIWFGGDVQGLDSILPDITCLHSLKNDATEKVSVKVMKDVQCTTFENAKKLVKAGEAEPSDFWVFAGYAGWGPQQLAGELDRKSWYMCATDSQTLLKELARQSAGADPRDAGLDVWELLMSMIGRGATADECSGDFEDLMLKEWSRQHLLSDEDKIGEGDMISTIGGDRVREGSLLRASSTERSPFLLSNQEYHKSIILVISEDDILTAGVMLNRPAARPLEMEIIDKETGERKKEEISLHFGGEYAIKGKEPLVWLHCCTGLRTEQVGSEVGGGIWKCSQDEAVKAISNGLASPQDFIVVSGVSVWPKQGLIARGMQGEIDKGNFQLIAPSRVDDLWKVLQKQEVLDKLNFVKNVQIANEAWEFAGGASAPSKAPTVTDGIGEGYDEQDDSVVHKTEKKVKDLSDDALRSWVATFLLGAPSLGH